MIRPLVGFLAAELAIGAVALLLVLAVCDLYLGQGRSVLTARGERLLGSAFRRLAPVVTWLIVRSRPVRAASVRLAVATWRLAVTAWTRGRAWVHAARTSAAEARSRRRAEVPFRPQVRVLTRGARPASGAGRAAGGRESGGRSRLRLRRTPARSGDGTPGRPGRSRRHRPAAGRGRIAVGPRHRRGPSVTRARTSAA